MASFSRLQKLAVLTIGAVGGGFAYYQLNSRPEKKYSVSNSWTTNYKPIVPWDSNWDHCAPEASVRPKRSLTPEEENSYNEELEKSKSKAVRHLFLIRHGQYYLDGVTDNERILTDIGRKQADLTGQRLAKLDIKWDLLVRSTMTRAQETASIIAKHLPEDLPVVNCDFIREGAPVPPEPPVGHWKPEANSECHKISFYQISPEDAGTEIKQFFKDGGRIEAAFRKYFYRAPPDQEKDTYTLLVCHANVIRFFVCRALQFPSEGWLRISLNHGSITWISIMPNGNVILRCLSETGYMDPKFVTSR